MATESDKYILGIERRPSPMCFLITIPLYMYRIRTSSFLSDINFFQKAVLRLKANPLVSVEDISMVLGIDQKLVEIVLSELKNKKLLDRNCQLTDSGIFALKEAEGLVTDSSKKEIGYVFKYVDRDEMLPSYSKKLIETDVIYSKEKNQKFIVTGTRDDGSDETTPSYIVGYLLKDKTDVPAPSDDDVLEAIKASMMLPGAEDPMKEEKQKKNLSIEFFPDDRPHLIWASTYIYLPRYNGDDDIFESDWSVLDPFTEYNSQSLKAYILSLHDTNLMETVEKRFSKASTIEHRRRTEYRQIREESINQEIESKIQGDLGGLDQNLQQYIRSVFGAFCDLRSYKFDNVNSSDTFTSNIQKALETIFNLDYHVRKIFYEKVDWRNSNRGYRINDLDVLYRTYFDKKAIIAPEKLRSTVKSRTVHPALKGWMAWFILSLKYDKSSKLLSIIQGKVQEMIELSDLRNPRQHGSSVQEGKLVSLTEDIVKKSFEIFLNIINNYIEVYVTK